MNRIEEYVMNREIGITARCIAYAEIIKSVACHETIEPTHNIIRSQEVT